MSYYFNKKVSLSFNDAVEKTTSLLQNEGFGVLTKIDLQDTFKKKLNKPFRKYIILGACNPDYAFKALQKEDKIGTMLPCNVIIQETDTNDIDVAAINPLVSMQAVKNPELMDIAEKVSEKLKNVIKNL